MIQKTYILDTNIYGELLIEKESLEVIRKIERDKSLFIYGVDVIGHELCNVPSNKKIKGKIFREAVLSTYESLIDDEISLSPLATYLASNYFKKYTELRKSGKYYKIVKDKELRYSERDLRIDFEIIAVASLKGVDVVVSADKRTMLSQLSTETYDIINKINSLRTPKLVDYFDFRERYKK